MAAAFSGGLAFGGGMFASGDVDEAHHHHHHHHRTHRAHNEAHQQARLAAGEDEDEEAAERERELDELEHDEGEGEDVVGGAFLAVLSQQQQLERQQLEQHHQLEQQQLEQPQGRRQLRRKLSDEHSGTRSNSLTAQPLEEEQQTEESLAASTPAVRFELARKQRLASNFTLMNGLCGAQQQQQQHAAQLALAPHLHAPPLSRRAALLSRWVAPLAVRIVDRLMRETDTLVTSRGDHFDVHVPQKMQAELGACLLSLLQTCDQGDDSHGVDGLALAMQAANVLMDREALRVLAQLFLFADTAQEFVDTAAIRQMARRETPRRPSDDVRASLPLVAYDPEAELAQVLKHRNPDYGTLRQVGLLLVYLAVTCQGRVQDAVARAVVDQLRKVGGIEDGSRVGVVVVGGGGAGGDEELREPSPDSLQSMRAKARCESVGMVINGDQVWFKGQQHGAPSPSQPGRAAGAGFFSFPAPLTHSASFRSTHSLLGLGEAGERHHPPSSPYSSSYEGLGPAAAAAAAADADSLREENSKLRHEVEELRRQLAEARSPPRAQPAGE
jgi:hypothetical protein